MCRWVGSKHSPLHWLWSKSSPVHVLWSNNLPVHGLLVVKPFTGTLIVVKQFTCIWVMVRQSTCTWIVVKQLTCTWIQLWSDSRHEHCLLLWLFIWPAPGFWTDRWHILYMQATLVISTPDKSILPLILKWNLSPNIFRYTVIVFQFGLSQFLSCCSPFQFFPYIIHCFSVLKHQKWGLVFSPFPEPLSILFRNVSKQLKCLDLVNFCHVSVCFSFFPI